MAFDLQLHNVASGDVLTALDAAAHKVDPATLNDAEKHLLGALIPIAGEILKGLGGTDTSRVYVALNGDVPEGPDRAPWVNLSITDLPTDVGVLVRAAAADLATEAAPAGE